MQNLEKWGILGSAKADVEIRVMALVVPLHWAQSKGVHQGKLFPQYCWGLGAPQNLKNLLSRVRNIFKMVHMKNYLTDDHHNVKLFCG
jgi:hypothetical protein